MTPGGPYGAEHAVVLPGQDHLFQMAGNIMAMNERRKKEEAARLQEEQDRQDQLMMYLGKEFDEKNFGTGTAMDRVINDSLSQIKQNYAAMIKANPNMRITDLGYLMQNDVAKLNRYSVTAKTVRQNIDEMAKAFEGNEGVDAKAIRQGALRNAFFKVDPETNSLVIKDPDEMDVTADYVGDFMDKNPELWVRGRQGVDKWIGGMKPFDAGASVSTDKNGITVTEKWDAKMLPFQYVKKDEKGNPIGLAVKSQQVQLDNGATMEVLDEASYQDFISEPSRKGLLDKKIKQHPIFGEIDRNSKEGEILRRRFAYEILSEGPQNSGFQTDYKQDMSAFRERMNAMGIAKMLSRSSGSGDGKEKKQNPIEGILRAVTGDPVMLRGEVDGRGLIDITSRIPGATLYSGKTKTKDDGKAMPESYHSVFYSPSENAIYVKDEEMAAPRKVENLDRFLEQIAEPNQLPLNQLPALKAKYMDQSGQLAWRGTVPREAVVEGEKARRNMAMKQEIDNFSVTKDPKALASTLFNPVTIDGRSGMVTDVEYAPPKFWRRAYVKFKHDGQEVEMNPDDFESILRQNLQ